MAITVRARVAKNTTSGISALENAQIHPATARTPAITASVQTRSLGTRRDYAGGCAISSESDREWYCSRTGECLRQAGKHGEVGVKLNAIQSANAERGEAVLVLESSELALDGRASTVEGTPPLRLTRDERVQTVGLDPPRLGRALSGWATPLACAALHVRPGERPGAVVALGGETVASDRRTRGVIGHARWGATTPKSTARRGAMRPGVSLEAPRSELPSSPAAPSAPAPPCAPRWRGR
jgi:hypothetical protein